LFLVSGGGSALFELPTEGVSLSDMADVTKQLLACGADIVEINTIRKHLSSVKGGRFAQLCAPAHVSMAVLSDVLGDRLDSIASGPAWPDNSTSEEALGIVRKYGLSLRPDLMKVLERETPKKLDNVTAIVTGSVSALCSAAMKAAEELGYSPLLLSTTLDCEAREAGAFLASVAREHAGGSKPLAFIAGGETVVHLTGKGKGGRNQELALSAARGIAGLENVVIASVGSDGTDGPTDAAGGIVDGETESTLAGKDISISDVLRENDAYNALKAVDSLLVTGPTGTNVNDLSFALIG
jgi:hydroxypyruvate reductase